MQTQHQKCHQVRTHLIGLVMLYVPAARQLFASVSKQVEERYKVSIMLIPRLYITKIQTHIQNQFVTRRSIQTKNWNRRRERRLLLGVISVHGVKEFVFKIAFNINIYEYNLYFL